MCVKVLLADHTTVIRKAIRMLLRNEPEIELVGEAENFAQTLILIHKLKPHVVVLDLHMPVGARLSPATVSNRLRSAAAKKLAISIWGDEDTKVLAESVGASALLDKMELSHELIPALMALSEKNGRPQSLAR